MTQLASMCKLKCGRLVREVADSCLQFWGGMGFTNEVLVSRQYRWVSGRGINKIRAVNDQSSKLYKHGNGRH